MVPKTDRIKVWKYFYGLTSETKNFTFEVKVILGFKSTRPDTYVAEIGLNGPHDQ